MVNAIIKGNQNTTKLIAELKKASKQFPPLKKNQEIELIRKYEDDREKLNNLLFMHNIRLVFNIAKKYISRTDDFDSMIQDGMLGLAIAAENFDTTRGIKFITYATPWIKKKVLERFYNKANEVIKRSVSLNSTTPSSTCKSNSTNDDHEFESYINDYLDPSVSLISNMRYDIAQIEQTQLCADLYNQLENDTSLSSTEKKIFVDMFYNKEKTRDISRKYNLETKDIAVIKTKILNKMRDHLKMTYKINSYSELFDM